MKEQIRHPTIEQIITQAVDNVGRKQAYNADNGYDI